MTDPRQSIDTDKGRLVEITRQFVGVKKDGSERWVETEYRTVTKHEWVGLTEEEFFDLLSSKTRYNNVEIHLIADVIRATQAKLKEKNT